MLTFVLPRKVKTEDFLFSELLEKTTIRHEDCGGGKVTISYSHEDMWTVNCMRCLYKMRIELTDKGRVDICKTAIDGEERKIGDQCFTRRKD